jgi:hypothetical protein
MGVRICAQAPHLDCFNSAWDTASIYAVLTLTLWGIFTPLALAVALHLARMRLRTAEFSRKFSLLTFGYKRQCVWWEVLSMLKKFLVSGCIVLFREAASVQSTLVLVTILAFLCLAVAIRPFYNRLMSALYVLGEVHQRPDHTRAHALRTPNKHTAPRLPFVPSLHLSALLPLSLSVSHPPLFSLSLLLPLSLPLCSCIGVRACSHLCMCARLCSGREMQEGGGAGHRF